MDLQAFWARLSARERGLVAGGTLVVVLLLGYSLVWEPWQQQLSRLRVQVPVQQETLDWMRQQATDIQPLLARAGQNADGGTEPLLTVIEQSADQAGLRQFIRRMTPGEGEQVKLWLTDADFDLWLAWIEQLRPMLVEVSSANITRAGNGAVNIRVTLQRGA